MSALRRFFRVVAILAGLTWGGMVALAARGSESAAGEWYRTVAFIVMIGAVLLARGSGGKGNTDETL